MHLTHALQRWVHRCTEHEPCFPDRACHRDCANFGCQGTRAHCLVEAVCLTSLALSGLRRPTFPTVNAPVGCLQCQLSGCPQARATPCAYAFSQKYAELCSVALCARSIFFMKVDAQGVLLSVQCLGCCSCPCVQANTAGRFHSPNPAGGACIAMIILCTSQLLSCFSTAPHLQRTVAQASLPCWPYLCFPLPLQLAHTIVQARVPYLICTKPAAQAQRHMLSMQLSGQASLCWTFCVSSFPTSSCTCGVQARVLPSMTLLVFPTPRSGQRAISA